MESQGNSARAMVLINVKRAEESLFQCQISANVQIKELAAQITELHNLRKRLGRVVACSSPD
jgi:hypothetical protein